MKAIFNKTNGWFLAGALWLASAVAWASPRISVHPLMEQGLRAEGWNASFVKEVANRKVDMTLMSDVEKFLEGRGGSCNNKLENEFECLKALGKATKVPYILTGEIYRFGNVYTVFARIIRVDGQEVKRVGPLEVQSVSKPSEAANVGPVYEKLLDELKLESLDPQPDMPLEEETETGNQSVKTPTGSEKDEGLPPKMSPMRTTSYVLWGVAGATALTGTVSALLANHNHKKFQSTYTPGTYDEFALAKALALRQKVSIPKTISIVAFSVATAATVAGTTLFFLSPERHVKKSVSLGLAPTAGGAVLSIQGVFP